MMNAGILGGGQLGKMLLQAAANYPVKMYLMDNDAHCPAAALTSNFVLGDIRNYDDVIQFGKDLDVITIEIENVNIDALEALENDGVRIIPKPAALRIIKNKITQKEFYLQNNIPTAEYLITDSKAALNNHKDFLPAVHKVGEGGYDGKGVQILFNEHDFEHAFDAPSVLEKMIGIEKEIAVIIGVSPKGDMAVYEPVDMVFDPKLNLLSHQISPAKIDQNLTYKIEAIAQKVAKALQSPGLFAIELLLDKAGNVLVNEAAPRVHNSGHHSIEACYSSQYDMLLRIMLGYPLGNPKQILPAAIVNIVGEPNANGPASYTGLKKVLSLQNTFVHIYGKSHVKPGRKMGHVTILSADEKDLKNKIQIIKDELKAVAQ